VNLGPPSKAVLSSPTPRPTLDKLFRAAAARRPDALALCDPPNRVAVTGGSPLRLTYARADRIVTAIATWLRRLGLPADTVVAMQLPNTAESVLTLLGVLRAGMIAAPIPLLWRRNDMVAPLRRIAPKVLISCARIGTVDYADLALQAAVEVFPVRYVAAFGSNVPDGIVPLDALLTAEHSDPPPAERSENSAAHIALITWEATAEGFVPVARNHMELTAGGVAAAMTARLEADSVLLSTLTPCSFAAVALTILPWLVTGGTLMMHHPFEPASFRAQLQDGSTAAVLPAAVISRFLEAGFFRDVPALKTVVGLWRSPERLSLSSAWCERGISFVDVAAFGESCLVPARRSASGIASVLPAAPIEARPEGAETMALLELTRSKTGTLMASGAMVPHHIFPQGAERSDLPYFKTVEGLVDTGFPCRMNPAAASITVTGPQPGVVSVGGYRFPLRQLNELVATIAGGGDIAVLPDALAGQRLAGSARDVHALREALARRGVNPLVARAFAAH